MGTQGTPGLLIVVVVQVLLAGPSIQAQIEGIELDNLHQDKGDNASRIIDLTGPDRKPKQAKPKQFPWQVYMETFGRDGGNIDIFFPCGGSIIDQQWVLTAAHCIVRPHGEPDGFTNLAIRIKMYAGITDKEDADVTDITNNFNLLNMQRDEFERHQIIPNGEYQRVFIHLQFNEGIVGNNDICLIKLNIILAYNDFVRPIMLATQDDFRPERLLAASGWGRMSFEEQGFGAPEALPDILRYVDGLRLKSMEDCRTHYLNLNRGFSDQMICHITLNKVPYKGDSGGAIIFKNHFWKDVPPTYVQLGIGSSGDRHDYATMFTNVARFRPWIHTTMDCGIYYSGACDNEIETDCREERGFFRPTGSEQCFRVLWEEGRGLQWEQAKQKCIDNGLVLARPFDALGLRTYLIQRYGTHKYFWLGARTQENPTNYMKWEDNGERIYHTSSLWYIEDHAAGCLMLLGSSHYWTNAPDKPYYNRDCNMGHYALCQLVVPNPQ